MNQITNSILSGMLKAAKLKEETKLQPQQERIVKRLKDSPGLLIYHGLGSGKTLSSIAAAEAIGGDTSVIVPASLRENYRKELRNYVRKSDAKYDIQSYESATKKGLKGSRTTIFDEAHRLGRSDSERSTLAGKASGKVLLLSGTPIRNRPSEAVPLLKAIAKDRNIPKSEQAFDDRFLGTKVTKPSFFERMKGIQPGEEQFLKNKSGLAALVRGRVDYHASSGEFPEVTHEFVESEMTPSQTDLYRGLVGKNPLLAYKIKNNLPPSRKESKQLNAFLAGVRQVSNDPATFSTRETGRPTERSPKIRKMFSSIVGHLQQDPTFKTLVYSNYLSAGVLPLAEELTAAGIPNAVFHGGLSDKQRKQIVESYNTNQVPVLLVSGAGSEGLDLKGTRLVQIMEPHWNAARVRQVIGRAVRNKSHAHLPPEQRHVHVEYHMVRPLPKSRLFGLMPPKYEQGADKYMFNLARRKQDLVDQVLDVFKEEGSYEGS